MGNVSKENGAFPNVLDDGTANEEAESVDVARATVNVLLVLVAALYWVVCAWVALNDTSPAPTRVIKFPDVSMVATEGLLLLYVIAPLLLLVGRIKLLNDASPNVLDEAIVKVDVENVEFSRMTSKNTIPLDEFLLPPLPPYNVYSLEFIVAVVNLIKLLDESL